MKASPITFLNLQFMRVHVEADFSAETPASDYSFDGALLSWTLQHGRDEDGRWWVAVGFATDHEEDPSKRSPYNIDVQAVGFFKVSDNVDADKRETMVYENGGALVFGAIRDMVANITARSIPGLLMLPTPTFVGSFASRKDQKV